MDGFGDDFEQPEVDPAAEFLAREQNQLAGLEDDLNPIAPAPPVEDAFSSPPAQDASAQLDPTSSFEVIDSFGQQDGFETVGGGFEAGAPEEQLPAADTEDENYPSTIPVRPIVREEPEKIRKWREEQKTRLEEKDANEETKKEEWKESAKRELEEWYKHHEDQIAKTKAANRSAEKQFVAETDEIEPGTEWERIAKLCDFNPKSSKSCKDVSRMRSIILQLKQSPPQAKRA